MLIGIAYRSDEFKLIPFEKEQINYEIFSPKEEDKYSKYDGFYLPGGDGWYKEDIKLIKYAKENNIPILGVCLGMQEISAFLLNEEKDITKKINNHNATEHLISIKKDSFLYNIVKREEIFVNSRHNDYIPKLSSLYVSARSLDNCIEAVEIKDNSFFLGVQWHPESLYEKDEASRRIFREFFTKNSQKKSLIACKTKLLFV